MINNFAATQITTVSTAPTLRGLLVLLVGKFLFCVLGDVCFVCGEGERRGKGGRVYSYHFVNMRLAAQRNFNTERNYM